MIKVNQSQKYNYREKVSFIIPTKDRPEELKNLLLTIKKQSYKPQQIIIVDAGCREIADLITIDEVSIDYVKVGFASLARQRNKGLEYVLPGITLIGFLDDDIEMQDNAIEEMLKFWQGAPDNLGGAIFNVITDKTPRFWWLKVFFLTGARRLGVVLRSGYNTKICPTERNISTQWLLGGVTVWKREVLERFKFDEWFQGYGLFEDFEYSYRVGKFYRLAVVSKARVKHHYLGIRRKDNYLFGKMEMINRYYIVKKNTELSILLFYWACFGQLLENLFRTLLEKKGGYLVRAAGNLQGFFQVIKDSIEVPSFR